MSDPVVPTLSNEVRASFEPIMKALDQVRQALSTVKDVAAVRPGYQYPATGDPIPAVVVAVTPGTAPVKAAELEKRFAVPFEAMDATVEEQLAAATKQAPVTFGLPEGPTLSAFEKLLGGEEAIEFGPPKTGCPFRKFHPAWIRIVRQNHRIIESNVCDPARARNVRCRPIQVAVPA